MEGTEEFQPFDVYDEGFNGMNDPDCDTWEEWMGWEGAGTRDYSSHVNPYAWRSDDDDFVMIRMHINNNRERL